VELRYQLADPSDLDAFAALARWYRNPEIKYFIQPNFDEAEMPDMTAEQIAAGYCRKDKLAYFIYDGSDLIGEVTIDTHFPMLHRSVEKTGWVSVIIGEPEYWRKGVGSAAMHFLEETCRSIGMQRIELGVFAFNERAFRMYQKLGYTEFGRIAHFTYQSGRWYDDIRMEKWL
jgi:RimJ/RimL family protein N-acetyltransferase